MKITYQFASIWRRILAGIGDYLTIWIFSFATMFLFLIKKDISKIFTDSSYPLEGWRFFCYSIVNFGIYFLYFVIIPYYWKGFSCWTKVAKIKMIDSQNETLTIKQLCLHNSLLWMIMMGWLIIIGTIYWIIQSLGQQETFLVGLFSFDFQNVNSNSVGFGIGFFCRIMMIIIGLIIGFFLINIIINKNTYALVDSISDTYLICVQPIKDVNQNDELLKKTLITKINNKNIPGIFDHETILDEKNN